MKIKMKSDDGTWYDIVLDEEIVFRRSNREDVWYGFNPYERSIFHKKENHEWNDQIR